MEYLIITAGEAFLVKQTFLKPEVVPDGCNGKS